MPMPLPDLRPDAPRQMLVLAGGVGLALGRVHAVCGAARRSFAGLLMGRGVGPVLWVQTGRQAERLFPDGLAALADPGRLITALARQAGDVLEAAEQALLSGAMPMIVADLPEPPEPGLVRHLLLATEAGMRAAQGLRAAPLVLLLTPDEGGVLGVESQWRMGPLPGPGPDMASPGAGLRVWQLDRLKARKAQPASWRLERDLKGGLRLV